MLKLDNGYAIVNKYEKTAGAMFNTSLPIKSNEAKFVITFALDNCGAFVFCVDLGGIFCILLLNIFKATAKCSVFYVENAGKIELCSLSPQELQQDFLDY